MFRRCLNGSCRVGRWGVVVAAIAVLGGLIFGKDLPSYLATLRETARDTVKYQVPVEFEMTRARELLVTLQGDIAAAGQTLAAEEVEVESQEAELSQRRAALEEKEAQVKAMRAQLGNGEGASELGSKLSAAFGHYKLERSKLEQDEQILETRRQGLAAARGRVEELIESRRELEVQIEQLAARIQTIEAVQAKTGVVLDDSKLSQAREMVNELQARLRAAEEAIEISDHVMKQVQGHEVESEGAPASAAEISEQIDEYFGEETPVAPAGQPAT